MFREHFRYLKDSSPVPIMLQETEPNIAVYKVFLEVFKHGIVCIFIGK